MILSRGLTLLILLPLSSAPALLTVKSRHTAHQVRALVERFGGSVLIIDGD